MLTGPYLQARAEEAARVFRQCFGSEPVSIARAPGRVNLIGEHTDYNDGFVLPVAINRDVLVACDFAGATGDDGKVRIYSRHYDEMDEFSLAAITVDKEKPWTAYCRGVLRVFQEAGFELRPFRAAVTGNVPQGAGLSSSAALEVAIATLLKEICALALSPESLALLCQRAENDFAGMRCGIMDQFVSVLAEPDSALLIDCRSLEHTSVPLSLSDAGLSLVVVDSGVRRGLVDSQYNLRRQQCETAVSLLQKLEPGRRLTHLRDVDAALLDRHVCVLPPVVARRCRHVVAENERVLTGVGLIRQGKFSEFGELLNASHESLRDDFGVSHPDVDVLVELTQAYPGALGARMTGAGFGGCIVALLTSDSVAGYRSQVVRRYREITGNHSKVLECSPAAGANIIGDR